MKYDVKEIFYSIQGEGSMTGKAAIFIRFSGCNLSCAFCDTKHDDGEMMETEQIMKAVKKHRGKLVILTGGEPTLWNLIPLIFALRFNGYTLALETNGTRMPPPGVYVICSPKRENGFKYKKAHELKYIMDEVFTKDDINLRFKGRIFLQPMWNGAKVNKKSLAEAISMVKELPRCQLSLQTQKWTGMR